MSSKEVIWEVKDEIINTIFRGWETKFPRGDSREWYAYCNKLGLKKSPYGGWMVETESELTMIMLKVKT